MDVLVPILLVALMWEHFTEAHSLMWQRDENYENTEFKYFFSKSTVMSDVECILISSSLSSCRFATFSSTTREFSQKCLKLQNGPTFIVFDKFVANFADANKTCERYGGRLAIIDSYEEQLNDALVLHYDVGFWWVGGIASINGMEWIDGRPLNISEKVWSPGNPSGNGDCLQFTTRQATGYHYDDVRCGGRLSFICEGDLSYCVYY